MNKVLTKDRAILLNAIIGLIVIACAVILQTQSLVTDESTEQAKLKSVGQELTSRAEERIHNYAMQMQVHSQLIGKYLSVLLQDEIKVSSEQLSGALVQANETFASIAGVSVKGIETPKGELIYLNSSAQRWQQIDQMLEKRPNVRRPGIPGFRWTIGISAVENVPKIYTSVELAMNDQYLGKAILEFTIEAHQTSFNLLNEAQLFLVNEDGIGFLLEQPGLDIYQLVFAADNSKAISVSPYNSKSVTVTKNDSVSLETWGLSLFPQANYYRMVTPLDDMGWYLNVFLDLSEYQTKLEADAEEVFWVVAVFFCLFLVTDRFLRFHYKVHELSITDPLTGLFNRMQFNRTSAEFLLLHDRDKISEVGVLSLDIDKFKLVNDTYGHAVGDKVLVILAKIMKQNSRRTDFLFRMGGEEFLVFSVGETLDGLVEFAQRLRIAVETNEEVRQHLPNGFTVSIGVVSRAKQENIKTLLERADLLLYQAKDNGRNRVEFHVD